MSRHTTFCLIAAVLLTTLPVTSPAQPIPPIAVCLEGEITDIIPARNEIRVMGVPLVVPPGAPIVTEVSDLQIGDLLGPPFPGRSQPGFLGGAAIVVGIMNGNDVEVRASSRSPRRTDSAG